MIDVDDIWQKDDDWDMVESDSGFLGTSIVRRVKGEKTTVLDWRMADEEAFETIKAAKRFFRKNICCNIHLQ